MDFIYFVEKGWGSYSDLINLTIKDLYEIKIAIESKKQEEELQKLASG